MEVFRERVEPSVEPQEAPHEPQIEKGDKESPDTYSVNKPEKSLEIWEGESRKKYVNEYFDTHNIYSDFAWKMPISKIDKYVREELATREYEKTTDNYKKILQEIESEISSGNLELSKRLSRLTAYIQWLGKKKVADENLKLYKNRDF